RASTGAWVAGSTSTVQTMSPTPAIVTFGVGVAGATVGSAEPPSAPHAANPRPTTRDIASQCQPFFTARRMRHPGLPSHRLPPARVTIPRRIVLAPRVTAAASHSLADNRLTLGARRSRRDGQHHERI